MSLSRDPEKLRAWRERGARNYRERVRAEVLAGERPRNSVPPVNRARKARMHERNFGDHADNIREMPCWWCERPGPSDPAHADPRGMGGCGGDKTVLLPMCRDCHDLYDDWKLAVDHDQAIADAKALHALMNPEDGDD